MLYPEFNDLLSLRHKTSQLALKSKKPPTSPVMGDILSPFRGQGLEFEEVREYAAGDDIRQIDWRVTARAGKPHTKVFREERERSVILCVDVNDTMRFGTRGTFKSVQAASTAALLGWTANANNDRLGCCLFGDVPKGISFYKPTKSRKSLWSMFRQLSSQTIHEDHPPVRLEDTLSHLIQAAPTGALIYIISDFYDLQPSLAFQLWSLKKRCDVVLITIDDAADSLMLPIGDIDFLKSQNLNLLINTDNKKGRTAYQEHWQNTRATLIQTAASLGIGIISIKTSDDVVSTLQLGLKKLSHRGGMQ